MKKILLLLMLIVSYPMFAQQINLHIAAPDTVWESDEFEASINATNFTDVGSFQIFIRFENAKLEVTKIPEGIIANTSIITNELDNINQTGEIKLVWLKLAGGSMLDGEMISFSFRVKSDIEQGVSRLTFSDDYITDTNGETITTESTGKDIFIYTIPKPIIRIDEVPAQPNSQIAVPVRFADFRNVIGLEFRLEYNSTKIEYIDVSNIYSALNEGLLVYNTIEINDTTTEFVLMWVYNGYDPLYISNEETEVLSIIFQYASDEEVLLEVTKTWAMLLNEKEIIPEYYSGKILNINSVDELENDDISREYRLYQNYPNPFNPSTTIGYFLPESDNITLLIYNSNGENLIKEVIGYKSAGYHEYTFSGQDLSSGVYYYQMVTNNKSITKKMTYLQ